MTPNTNMLASLPKLQINDGIISFELVIDTLYPSQTKKFLKTIKAGLSNILAT